MVVSGKTKVLGILGYPVYHSASPLMHNAMASLLNIDYVYVPFRVPPSFLKQALEGIKALDVLGVNVTIPHKKAVMSFLDEISPCAQRVGAVNTIVNQSGRLIGYNTDFDGFVYGLKQELSFDLTHKKVLIVGAGGAARAILVGLLDQGVSSVHIMNRTESKLMSFLRDYCDDRLFPAAWADQDLIQDMDLIIQTTPVGMNTSENPLPESQFHAKQVVVDIIYTPLETNLLRSARLNSAITLNGVSMLAAQGILAFEKFTGLKGSYPLFKQTIIRSLK